MIKSALEIALEKTKDIKVDPEKIKRKEETTEGRKLMASILSGNEESEKKISLWMKDKKANELRLKGALQVILDNFALPEDEEIRDGILGLKKALTLLVEDKSSLDYLWEQMAGFFNQYLENKKTMIEQIKEQFLPRLQQKQEQIRRQTGSSITLRPEQDPEYQQVVKKNLENLKSRFSQAIDEIRGQIQEITAL